MKLKHLLFVICVASLLFSCKNENDLQGELVTVKLSPSFISLNQDTDVPMNVKGNNVKMSVNSNQVIYAIQVYENDSAYYYGVFDNIDSMKIAVTTGKIYRFKIATYENGTGNGLKQDIQTDGKYFYLPNKTLLGNKFIRGNSLKDINLKSSIKLAKTTINDYPEIDVHYCDKSVTIAKGITSIDFSLLRMGFGVTYYVDGLTNGRLNIYMGDDTIHLTPTIYKNGSIRLFNTSDGDFGSIFKNANTFSDSIPIQVQWAGTNGTNLVIQKKFLFSRNYQKTINIQLNTSSLNLNFEGWSNVRDTINRYISFINYSNNNFNPCTVKCAFDTTQWHSFAVSIASNTNIVKLYVDGTMIKSSYMYTGQSTPTNNVMWAKLYLGTSFVTNYSDFYKGLFDELRISNCVRTDQEISNTYKSKTEFISDVNTVALWHYNDNTLKNSINQTLGSISGDVSYKGGIFGNCLNFGGLNGYVNCNYDMPEKDVTIEFWAKFNGDFKSATLLQPYGMYSGNIVLSK